MTDEQNTTTSTESETQQKQGLDAISRRSVLTSMAVVGGAAGLRQFGAAASQVGEYQEIPKGTTVQLEKVAEGLTHPPGSRSPRRTPTGDLYWTSGGDLRHRGRRMGSD